MAQDQSQGMDIHPAPPTAAAAPPAYNDNKGGQTQLPAQPQHAYSGGPQHPQPMSYPSHAAGQGQRMVVPLDRLGDQSQDIDCPYCQRQTRTRVESHASGMTIAAGILIGCLCLCLAWIPCAAHWLYDTEWYCGNCNAKLAYQLHDSAPVVVHTQGPAQVPSAHAGHPMQVQHGQGGPQVASYQQGPQQEQGVIKQ